MIPRILIQHENHNLYSWIQNEIKQLQSNSLSEKVFWILNDMHDFPICDTCCKKLNSDHFRGIRRGYVKYCSLKCKSSSPKIKQKIKQKNNSKSIEQKQIEINKRLATYNRHKAEDPEFVKRKQEKSVATRKKNHGEDYTGRKKCQKTLESRYGVSNPMKIKEVKDHIKQHNLETYGVEWHIASSEIREKSKQTYQKNYGVDNPFAAKEIIEQIKQHNLENYGVEYNWQREDVKQHIRETNKQRYGYENAVQNPEIRSKMASNIKYDGKSFDSYPEVCLYIWLIDNNLPFEFQSNASFKYVFNGKNHIYCPDFKVGDIYFEIKGDHFFKDDGTMQNPYDHSQDSLYEAKHQCMLQNNVVILRSNEYAMFILYIEKTYGKDFYNKIKNQCNLKFKV